MYKRKYIGKNYDICDTSLRLSKENFGVVL